MGIHVSKPKVMPETKYLPTLMNKLSRMDGKVVAITVCTSGMGLICAKALGDLGAQIIMINRDSDRAIKALTMLKNFHIDAYHISCDLQSFQSVNQACEVILKQWADKGIDILCNNAGVMGCPDVATIDGYDIQMQSNHLSHF